MDVSELKENKEVKENEEIEITDDKDVEMPGELQEILEDVPEEKRKVIERLMISSIQMRGIGSSPEATVMKKLTPEHISKYLEGAEEEMKNSYKEKFHKKIFIFFTMLLAMVFVIVIVVLLKDSPEIMEKVLYTLGGVVAGAFGGYGLGKNQKED